MKKRILFLLTVLWVTVAAEAQYTSPNTTQYATRSAAQYASPNTTQYATRSAAQYTAPNTTQAAQYSSPYTGMMSSGSPYVSAPHAVGAASPEPMYSPATPPSYAPSGPRRDAVNDGGAPVDDEDDYDPNNPDLVEPLTDGTGCLLLLLALYAAATGWMKRRKRKVT